VSYSLVGGALYTQRHMHTYADGVRHTHGHIEWSWGEVRLGWRLRQKGRFNGNEACLFMSASSSEPGLSAPPAAVFHAVKFATTSSETPPDARDSEPSKLNPVYIVIGYRYYTVAYTLRYRYYIVAYTLRLRCNQVAPVDKLQHAFNAAKRLLRYCFEMYLSYKGSKLNFLRRVNQFQFYATYCSNLNIGSIVGQAV
jgi:hypothetical protein